MPAAPSRIIQNKSAASLEQLRRFRATHPYQTRQVQGLTWRYIDTGTAGPPLLVLGGGMSTGESSFGVVGRLEKQFRVICPSYPAVSSLGQLTDGLAGLLDKLNARPAQVYGHSLGAAVGHILVRRHPEYVRGLVLSGFGLYEPRRVKVIRGVIRLFRLLPYRWVAGYYEKRVAKLMSKASAEEQDFWKEYTHELLHEEHNRATFLGQFELLVDLIDRAAEYGVRQPPRGEHRVLMLLAADDTGFTQAEQQALIDTYPGAHVHRFASGGHLAAVTQREEYEHVLDNFLLKETAHV